MKHSRTWVALVAAFILSTVGLTSAAGVPVASAVTPAAAPRSLAPPAPGSLASSTHQLLVSPAGPPRAHRLFDPPAQPWLAGHRGIDLLTSPAAEVYSPGDGVVAFAGYVVNRPVISIDLDLGLRASMEPVANVVEVGQRVRRGQLVGTVDDAPGAGHCEPQWCVHWGLRIDGRYVNPLDWLRGYGPIHLLPIVNQMPRSS